MDQIKLYYLIETLKLLNQPEDYDFRQAIKKELAYELDMLAGENKVSGLVH